MSTKMKMLGFWGVIWLIAIGVWGQNMSPKKIPTQPPSVETFADGVISTLRNAGYAELEFSVSQQVVESNGVIRPEKTLTADMWMAKDKLIALASASDDGVYRRVRLLDGRIFESCFEQTSEFVSPFPNGTDDLSINSSKDCQIAACLGSMIGIAPFEDFRQSAALDTLAYGGFRIGNFLERPEWPYFGREILPQPFFQIKWVRGKTRIPFEMPMTEVELRYNSTDAALKWANHIRNSERDFAAEEEARGQGHPSYIFREKQTIDLPDVKLVIDNVIYLVVQNKKFLVERCDTAQTCFLKKEGEVESGPVARIERYRTFNWRVIAPFAPVDFDWRADPSTMQAKLSGSNAPKQGG